MRYSIRAITAVLAAAALLAACSAEAADSVSEPSSRPTTDTSSESASGPPSEPAADSAASASDDPSDDGSPAARTSYPFTIDNCGTEVTFTHSPERVVAIKSTSIEMMFALGLADRLVGVAFPDGPYADEWAPDAEPTLISDRVPGQEATLELEPDLIYAGWESNVTADGAGDRAELADLGVVTFVSPAACQEADYQPTPLNWDDIWSEIELVGKIFDVEERATSLVAELQQRLTAVEQDTRGLTALWYSSGTKAGTPYVGAGIGAPQIVMDAVGLTNIAADIPMTWSSMSWEAAIAADPDVIVVVDSSWGPAEMKIGTFEEDPAVSSLTAVKNKRYLLVPFPAGEAGVRSVEAAETISAELAKLDLP